MEQDQKRGGGIGDLWERGGGSKLLEGIEFNPRTPEAGGLGGLLGRSSLGRKISAFSDNISVDTATNNGGRCVCVCVCLRNWSNLNSSANFCSAVCEDPHPSSISLANSWR